MNRFLLLFSLLPCVSFGWDVRSSWRIPVSEYRDLDFTVRSGIDRASKLFKSAVDFERGGGKVTEVIPRFRAAAAEWRKVQVQAEAENFNETVAAYSVFMQAYSKELSHDRNDAVKLYSEVIDIYPDVKFVALMAYYRLGCTQLAMGDLKRGMETVNSLVNEYGDEVDSVLADAMLMLADHLWNEKKTAEAQAKWTAMLDNAYCKNCYDQWNAARRNLMMTSFMAGDFEQFKTALFAEMPEGSSAEMIKRIDEAYSAYNGYFISGHHSGRFQQFFEAAVPNAGDRSKRIAAKKKEFAVWFNGQGSVYEKANLGGRFKMMEFRIAVFTEGGEKLPQLLGSVKKLISAEKDIKTQVDYADGVIDSLRRIKRCDLARSVPDCVRSPLSAAWMRYEIEAGEHKWKEALVFLEEYLLHKPSSEQVKRVKYIMAEIYRDRLADYERAEKLYLDINDPPRSLWDLQLTYRKMGKKTQSYQLLNEIASIFPQQAANAVLTAARYYEEDGQKSKAISLYRQLLTHPEWKKSGASSQAHQALERYGIATGGAMINEVR